MEAKRQTEYLADLAAALEPLRSRYEGQGRSWTLIQVVRDVVAEVEHLEAKAERLEADRNACVQFIENEMFWCGLREEMLSDDASAKNARKLLEFLQRQPGFSHGRRKRD